MNPGDSWDNVSIYELEIYSEEAGDTPSSGMTMDQVADSLRITEIGVGELYLRFRLFGTDMGVGG